MITRQFPLPLSSAFLSIILALLTLTLGHSLTLLSKQPYFHRHVRRFIADYGMPLAVIACSGLAYWGRFHTAIDVEGATLPVQRAFQPAGGRQWLVRFWTLEGKWVGVAFPFGFVLFVVSLGKRNSVFFIFRMIDLLLRLLALCVRSQRIFSDSSRVKLSPKKATWISLGL